MQKTIKLLLLTLLGFMWSSVTYAACSPQLLTEEMSAQINTANLTLLMLEDPAREMTIEQVSALPDSAFRPVSGTLSASGRGGSLWLRLCFERESHVADDWLLTMLPPYIQSVNLYQFDGDSYTVKTQGFALPFDLRDVNYRGFTYRLSLPENKAELYTMRLDFSNRMNADVLLLTQDTMYRLIAVEYSMFGLYIGMLLLVIFINLIFWLRLRDSIYWRYALAMLSVGSFSVITGGYGSQFLYLEGGEHLHRVMMVSYALCGIFLSLFIQSAFQFKKLYPLLYRGSWFFIGIYVVLLLMALLGNALLVNGLISRLNLVAIIVLLMVSLHALYRHRSIRLYAFAFLPLQVAMLLMAIRALGYGGWIPLADHLPNVGALVHLVLLNLALARRAWQAEKDKQAAREDLLDQARTHNLQLEEKVVARTSELDKTNAALQSEIQQKQRVEIKLREALLSEQVALKTQQEFVAMVSHEFRSPLAVIDTAAQNLEGQLAKADAEVLSRIQRIRRNISRMVTLINNCLSSDRLSTYSSGQMHLHKGDLVEFLRQTLPEDYASGRVVLELPSAPIEVVFDAQLLSVIVSNLVSNALKYSPESTPVHVRLREQGKTVELDVCDQGIGVSEDERQKIFHKFYRAASAQHTPGAGLGLYLAHTLAKQHGGLLELLPTTPGQIGSCFRLHLPIARDSEK